MIAATFCREIIFGWAHEAAWALPKRGAVVIYCPSLVVEHPKGEVFTYEICFPEHLCFFAGNHRKPNKRAERERQEGDHRVVYGVPAFNRIAARAVHQAP